MGVDAISIDGFECAGHPGEDDIPGLVLIPAAADKVTIPMLAIAADSAMVAGWSRRWRSAPTASTWAPASAPPGRRRSTSASSRPWSTTTSAATDLIFRSYRNTARVARNAISQEVLKIEAEGRAFEAVSHLVKGARGREGLASGELDHGVWTAGIVQGLIKDIPTVRELVDRIVAEAEAIISKRLGSMMSSQTAA